MVRQMITFFARKRLQLISTVLLVAVLGGFHVHLALDRALYNNQDRIDLAYHPIAFILGTLAPAVFILGPFAYWMFGRILRRFKVCEHCAETIKSDAKVCRYCGREVAPAVRAEVQSRPQAAASIGKGIAQAIRDTGAILLGVVGFVALVFLSALLIKGLAWVSENTLEYLIIATCIALATCVFILLPCALFRATRNFSAYGLLISSVIFGASTWILGFLVTLQYWGVIGVFVGVIMGVVGIVPLGMLASAFHSDWPTIGMLAVGLVLTFGVRMIAVMLAAWIDRDNDAMIAQQTAERSEPVIIAQPAILQPPSPSFLQSSGEEEFASKKADELIAPDPARSPPTPDAPTLASDIPLKWIGAHQAWVSVGVLAFFGGLVVVFFASNGASKNIQPTSSSQPVSNSRASSAVKAPQSLENADAAYGRGDYATALKLFRPLADQGNALAQYGLGVMHTNGQGLPQNYAEAARWYRLAAEQGLAVAQNHLGSMYDNGQGAPRNYAEAIKWFRLAADQGLAVAQINLGYIYAYSLDMPRNYAEAIKWFRLAADQGYAEAQFNLGNMYAYSPGVPQNYAEAMKWYRLAADQGYAEAQYNLGAMYESGQGVPQDYVRAHMWFNLAAAQGNQDAVKIRDLAVKFRDLIEQRMTPAQLTEAQKLARESKPTTPPPR